MLVISALAVPSAWSAAQTSDASGCLPNEGILFSCRLEGNSKVVSLCTAPKAAPFQAITYRYGTTGKNELTYVASTDNHRRFLGTVSPASPKASVRQVWFELQGTRYVTTACVGGDCAHRGGIIVLQAGKVVMSRACTSDSSHAWFSSQVVHFQSDLQSSQSKTDLIHLEDYDNNVNALYP